MISTRTSAPPTKNQILIYFKAFSQVLGEFRSVFRCHFQSSSIPYLPARGYSRSPDWHALLRITPRNADSRPDAPKIVQVGRVLSWHRRATYLLEPESPSLIFNAGKSWLSSTETNSRGIPANAGRTDRAEYEMLRLGIILGFRLRDPPWRHRVAYSVR